MPAQAEIMKQTTVAIDPNAFVRQEVASDGDCGYTAFGITREKAFELLNKNLEKVKDLLSIVAKATLLEQTPQFIDYLKTAGIIDVNISHEQIREQHELYASDPAVLRALLQYDVKEKQVVGGWVHFATLQALAEIQGIKLRIWLQNKSHELIPYYLSEFASYTPTTVTEQEPTDLLFINNNHFERIEFKTANAVEQAEIVQNDKIVAQQIASIEEKPAITSVIKLPVAAAIINEVDNGKVEASTKLVKSSQFDHKPKIYGELLQSQVCFFKPAQIDQLLNSDSAHNFGTIFDSLVTEYNNAETKQSVAKQSHVSPYSASTPIINIVMKLLAENLPVCLLIIAQHFLPALQLAANQGKPATPAFRP